MGHRCICCMSANACTPRWSPHAVQCILKDHGLPPCMVTCIYRFSLFACLASQTIKSCVKSSTGSPRLFTCLPLSSGHRHFAEVQRSPAQVRLQIHLPSSSFLSPTLFNMADQWQQELAEIEERNEMLMQQRSEEMAPTKPADTPPPTLAPVSVASPSRRCNTNPATGQSSQQGSPGQYVSRVKRIIKQQPKNGSRKSISTGSMRQQ